MNRKIKIIISYHKRGKLLKNNVLTPVFVGKSIANKESEDYKWLNDNMIGDNVGENISSLNGDYCELSSQYWAWKNYSAIGNPDYIGFMHYRRVFNFSEDKVVKDLDDIDFSQKNIMKNIKNADIVVTKQLGAYSKKLGDFTDNVETQWKLEHDYYDIKFIYDRVKTLYPDYLEAFDEVLASAKIHWYNMFIMKKQEFFNYSYWLFRVLDVNSDVFYEKKRIKGYLAEILLNVYIFKNRNNKVIKEIPMFKDKETKNIPIVIATDDNYAPHCATAMLSIVNNLAEEYRAKFYILVNRLNSKNKRRLEIIKTKNPYLLEFIYIKDEQLNKFSKINKPAYISNMAYARLMIPEIIKGENKVLYLDCDILALKDISKLFNENISGYFCAGVEDVNTYAMAKNIDLDLYKSVYVNSGVLLLNLEEMRNLNYLNLINNAIKEKGDSFCCGDQDLINYAFAGKIKFLPQFWNMHHVFHSKEYRYMPDNYSEYIKAKEEPCIIHFVGKQKPWMRKADNNYKQVYFNYYSQTPFYHKEDKINRIYDLIQKVFSVKNHRWHKIICVLGFKLKLNNNKKHLKDVEYRINQQNILINNLNNVINNICYSSIQANKYVGAANIMEAFIRHVDSNEMLHIVENHIGPKNIFACHPYDLLIYICTLIENNLLEKASYILEQYISLYGLAGIWRYLPVAKFAKEKGYSNSQLEKACYVYDRLNSNAYCCCLEKLLQSKTVAIVGNGPSEIGKSKGAEIDSHDIVIRCNNYRTIGYEQDYGSKTDIWARGAGADDVEDKTKINNYIASIWTIDFRRFPILYNFLDILYRDLQKEEMLTVCMNSDFMDSIKLESEIFFPTTGFNIATFIHKYCKVKELNFYGFSFLQDKVDGYSTHYFNDRSEQTARRMSKPHSFEKESYYMNKITDITKNSL